MGLLSQGKAQELTLYCGESDQWHGEPLSVAIVNLARAQGCSGITVSRAIAGYGATGRLHHSGAWQFSSDVPLIIQIIDQPERIRRLLPQLQEMLQGGLMTLHEVEVLAYSHATPHGIPTHLTVQQIMETALTTAPPTASAQEVIQLLLPARFRVLPIVDEQQRLLGIISTGDLIRTNVLPVRRSALRTAQELDASPPTSRQTLQAQDIMNRQVQTITPTSSLKAAAQQMLTTGRRQLPVLAEDGRLLGMITRSDILLATVTSPLMSETIQSEQQPAQPISGSPLESSVMAIAATTCPTVFTRDSTGAVIDALVRSPLRRVFVLDEQRHLVGIIADIDVLTQIQAESRSRFLRWLASWTRGRPESASQKFGPRADTLMNSSLVTIPETATIREAIERLLHAHHTVIPVIDADRHLKGYVERSHALRLIAEEEPST